MKYGVNSNFELRLISEYLGTSVRRSELQKTHIQGFGPLAIGVKVKLWDENRALPQAGLIAHVKPVIGLNELAPGRAAADLRFTFSNTINDVLSVSYNLGAEWIDGAPLTFLYTLSLGYSVNKKLGAFAEVYSFFRNGWKADNRMDGGFIYKITPRTQFDVSGGIGLVANSPDFFMSTGFSFRVFK